MLCPISLILAAAVLGLRATAQSCAGSPLCCHRLIYNETAKAEAIAQLGRMGAVPSSEVVYPMGMGCFSIENPPNDALIDW